MKKISIFHFPFANDRGYTLVELLTVIGILSVIGGIVVSVIFISLRGTQKSDTLEVVRQNGDVALSQMIKSIRYAKSLNAPTACATPSTTSSITITSMSDNGQTVYSCTGDTIASNSAPLINTYAVEALSCSFTCSQANAAEPPTITIQFSLSARSSGDLVENKATIPFQSSVTMRNYLR